jgi:hypothetical protein
MMKVCYEGYPNPQFCSHSGFLCFLHVSINDNLVIIFYYTSSCKYNLVILADMWMMPDGMHEH